MISAEMIEDHASAEKLVDAGHQLERAGYEFVGLLEPGPEDEDQETIAERVIVSRTWT